MGDEICPFCGEGEIENVYRTQTILGPILPLGEVRVVAGVTLHIRHHDGRACEGVPPMARLLTDAEITEFGTAVASGILSGNEMDLGKRLLDEVARARALLKRCAAAYNSVPTGDDEDNEWKCAICEAHTNVGEDHVPHAADCELMAPIGK